MWLAPPRRALGDIDYPPPNTAPAQRERVRVADIPEGNNGAIATLRVMRDFANEANLDPSQLIRGKALELVSGLPPRQWFAEIRALHAFVRDSIRYVRDPVDAELVQTPEATLRIGQGDCDDKATLLAALLKSIGHPARFVALDLTGDGFSHVLVETKISSTGEDAKDWMPLETIIDVAPGWYPKGVQKRYVRSV